MLVDTSVKLFYTNNAYYYYYYYKIKKVLVTDEIGH